MPVNTTMSVLPLFDIPPHTCTLRGVLWYWLHLQWLSFLAVRLFSMPLQSNSALARKYDILTSLQRISAPLHPILHISYIFWWLGCIYWWNKSNQSSCLALATVLLGIFKGPNCSIIFLSSFLAVNSSSLAIASTIKWYISSVTDFGLPERCLSSTKPVAWYLAMVMATVCLVVHCLHIWAFSWAFWGRILHWNRARWMITK